MKQKEIVKVRTIEEFTELFGIPSIGHPLINISCAESRKLDISLNNTFRFNFYTISLKQKCNASSKYGWREYDFSKGLMNFFAPGQIHTIESNSDDTPEKGWVLVFHPDFIRKYPLGTKIGKLKFFSYEINEALHLSDAERSMVEGIMNNIQDECTQNIDEHSQDIIVSQLDVLLNYSERFYTRQFRTRGSVESDIVTRFQSLLREHFENDKERLITAGDIASQLAMSTHYLSDLLRNLTGQNTQQHIHAFLIERAKSLLLTTRLSVNEIAFSLGFDYPQYFSRLFKSKTGQTPLEFRNTN